MTFVAMPAPARNAPRTLFGPLSGSVGFGFGGRRRWIQVVLCFGFGIWLLAKGLTGL